MPNSPDDMEDLQALAEFLRSERTPPSAMSIDVLHGFLTGLTVAPCQVSEHEWLSCVWSKSGTEAPRFDNPADEARILHLILGLKASIAAAVFDGKSAFDPVVAVIIDHGQQYGDGEGWCVGFMEAIALRRDVWRAFLRSSAGQDILSPILELAAGNPGNMVGRPMRTAEAQSELTAGIVEAVQEAFIFVRQWPMTRATTQSEQCPCGSGHAFSACCGAVHRLH